MSKVVEKFYNASQNRYKICQLLVNQWLTKNEVTELSGLGLTPSSIRTICDDLLLKGYIETRNCYNKDIKRWTVKYHAVVGKPYPNVSYEKMLEDYERTKSDKWTVTKKGKYDDLIAKNPNLRVIKGVDKEMQQGWKMKLKNHFRGIPSSFYIEE